MRAVCYWKNYGKETLVIEMTIWPHNCGGIVALERQNERQYGEMQHLSDF